MSVLVTTVGVCAVDVVLAVAAIVVVSVGLWPLTLVLMLVMAEFVIVTVAVVSGIVLELLNGGDGLVGERQVPVCLFSAFTKVAASLYKMQPPLAESTNSWQSGIAMHCSPHVMASWADNCAMAVPLATLIPL